MGVHVSIAGGLEKAVERARKLGCSAMQIFSRNPRGWQASPLNSRAIINFCNLVGKGDIDPIIIHTPYLLNLASPDERIYKDSIYALALDLQRAQLLGANFVVTHIGSFKEKDMQFGLQRVIQALKVVVSQRNSVILLLENGAGGGREIGSTFEQLQMIIEGVKGNKQIGICFDSCHAFVAGYDFRNKEKANQLAREIERTIGFHKLCLLHINDTRGDLSTHLDRHEHIGQGKIGILGFRNLLAHPSFRGIPIILETPKMGPHDDWQNLTKIRQILKGIYGEV